MKTISLTEMTWPEFARGLPHTVHCPLRGLAGAARAAPAVER